MVLGKEHKSNIAEDLEEGMSETITEEITETIDLSVSQLDGVGGVTTKKLETFGVTSLIDICIREQN